jgi:hypothetical protein
VIGCPECARDNPDDAKICIACANLSTTQCAKSGAVNSADTSICKQNGTRLDVKAAPSAATASSRRIRIRTERVASDDRRKTLTALFADIEGLMDRKRSHGARTN